MKDVGRYAAMLPRRIGAASASTAHQKTGY